MPWWPFSLGGASMGDTSSPALSPPKSNPPSSSAPSSSSTAATKHVQGPGGATDPDAPEGAEAQTALASWAALLEPFSAGGGALPEKARTDVRQKLARPNAHLWEYVPFFAKQGTSLTKAFVQHHIYGPPKPSWGVELTLFTTFLREVSTYSHLSSLARLRSALELSSLLPTPKDGIVTPISFKVKRRNLRGLLAESDALETGNREIAGEWVTNKRLWRRMTREWTLDKPAEAGAGAAAGAGGAHKGASGAASSGGGGNKDGLVCLYLHGGAYYMFSAETHRYLTISVSRYCDARVFAINYRLAPETRFPGQLHDAVSAYMRLTVDLKIPAENIIIAGDSAGGGLALATLMYLRDEGYPLPSGGVLMSPWVDLTMSCESWTTNRPYDYLPTPNDEDDHMHPVKCLLGDQIDMYLTHPYVSPLFGKFEGLPPLLIQAGDAEVLRDEITLLAHKAAIAGVKVEHEIFEDCVHVFQAFLFLEASRKAFQSQRAFVKHTLPRLKRKAAERAASSASSTSAPGSAPTAAATSNAPSPDERDESSAAGESASSGFDFGEVDRSIAADAHEVDQQGNADKKSLPSPPSAGGLDLPSGSSEEDEVDEMDGLDDEMDDDDELGVTDVDMTTDSSDAAASPVLRGKRRAVHSPTDERATADALINVRAPSPDPSTTSSAAPTTSASSSSTSSSATPIRTSPSASPSPTALASPSLVDAHPSVRPILRAYASARDLSMSTLRKTHSLSSPSAAGRRLSLAPPPSTTAAPTASLSSSPRKRRSATVTSLRPPTTGGTSALSAPSTPLALSPRPLDQRRELHARSSSHPDVAELLRSYMDEREAGEAPRAKTRVWTAAAAGGRSSRAASEVDEVE
ncbi:hypothetical protein JCM8208_004127 [Rhodotorula glutinis]